jgi:hypothetical protein
VVDTSSVARPTTFSRNSVTVVPAANTEATGSDGSVGSGCEGSGGLVVVAGWLVGVSGSDSCGTAGGAVIRGGTGCDGSATSMSPSSAGFVGTTDEVVSRCVSVGISEGGGSFQFVGVWTVVSGAWICGFEPPPTSEAGTTIMATEATAAAMAAVIFPSGIDAANLTRIVSRFLCLAGLFSATRTPFSGQVECRETVPLVLYQPFKHPAHFSGSRAAQKPFPADTLHCRQLKGAESGCPIG